MTPARAEPALLTVGSESITCATWVATSITLPDEPRPTASPFPLILEWMRWICAATTSRVRHSPLNTGARCAFSSVHFGGIDSGHADVQRWWKRATWSSLVKLCQGVGRGRGPNCGELCGDHRDTAVVIVRRRRRMAYLSRLAALTRCNSARMQRGMRGLRSALINEQLAVHPCRRRFSTRV